MSQTGINYMLTQMNEYFTKVKTALATGGSASFRYKTGSIAAGSTAVIDAPTELGFAVAQYNVYSLGVQLAVVDPTVATNPPVISAEALVKWEISADGKVTLRNNHVSPVTYHLRITMPVKK